MAGLPRRFACGVSCLVWALLVAACDAATPEPADTDAGSEGVRYPLDDVLRVDHLQVKATHNSYHIAPPSTPVVDWQYTFAPLDVQLAEQGVRGFELDTHFNEADGVVEVFHVPQVDNHTTCWYFVECLEVLKDWSDAHPGHHVLLVQIEPKDAQFGAPSDWEEYASALDAEVLSVWPRERVVAPADVQGEFSTLREAVTTRGWPTLGETRQKILFFLNERGPFHDTYTRGGSSVEGRLIFPQSNPEEPIAAVLVLNDPRDERLDDRAREGFLIRTRADAFPWSDGHTARRVAALGGGAHLLSTDWPVADEHAEAFELPGGTPSRCNPITAPAECTAEDIENPAWLAD